ncbi:N-acetylmuramoyl-L-alanine amidase [Ornithinibacillus sp. 4-3]|uniref:N-acetylmuramoyl-L-alanine amidase n=1 Tax=Ornithinibacillus sp. 4-3 TaxID=3231488 RepID=A0AB39HQE8_9BACI
MKKIFIDPGHGGRDPGAIANGLQEKSITLAIALQTKVFLEQNYEGVLVQLSRSTDQTLSLVQRTNMANQWQADLFVSIHVNAGGGTGFESFIYDGLFAERAKTDEIRKMIHHEIVQGSDFFDRGCKAANFHVLRATRMSAVLVENGFIDRLEDARQLKSYAFIERLALAHANGIAKAIKLLKQDKRIWHVIIKGDTLWSLAQSYQTSVEQLMKLNTSINPLSLQIGQKIRVN